MNNLNIKLSILEGINPRYNLRKICKFELQLHFELKCRIYIWVKNWSTTNNLDSGAILQYEVLGTHPAQPWLVSRK